MLEESPEGTRLMSRVRPLPRNWAICLVTVALMSFLAAACNADSTPDGPGPVGSVGPVGPVGGEEEGIPGSGDITTETPPLDDFDRVVFSSEGTVTLTQAETASLAIDADDNLHQYLVTNVSNGELTISTTESTDIAPSRRIEFRIGVVDLSGVELAGAGTITAEAVQSSAIEVVLSGTGDIIINQLRADEVTVNHTGVGTIQLTGETDQQEVVASGTGDYDGADLVSRTATVEASGLADVTVNVTDDLQITVSESGAVAFYGSPTVDQDVSDSGDVTALGPR